jgi:hypothetical protein
VPKSGGGKELTKQSPDEITVKCHINLEEADKARTRTTDVLNKNALAIRSAQITPEDRIERKIKAVLIQKNKICQTEVGKIMSKLYNIETAVEREKPSKIDIGLNLYQMEEP